MGSEHTSTLDTVNNLGLLYSDQGKLEEAEEMYQRALKGYISTPDDRSLNHRGQAKLSLPSINRGDARLRPRSTTTAAAETARRLLNALAISARHTTDFYDDELLNARFL
jgi:Tfp pilus assembly protein PilF